MQTTFKTGLPSTKTVLRTPYGGPCTFVRMADEGHVYLYVGGGRTFKVADATPWDPA